MAILAGEIVPAGRLNRMQSVTYYAEATSQLDVTNTTETDIPGATYTLTTAAAGATYVVTAFFDCRALAASATIVMVGKCMVDGVLASGTAIQSMVDIGDRGTPGQVWRGTLASAGSHTFKLRGNLSNTLATGGRFSATNTRFVVEITEVA